MICVITLKYFFIYVPFTVLLFYLVSLRNKIAPNLSKLKITFLVFCILYYFSATFSGFVSYFSHRALHTPYLFQFHKEHHEYIAPVAASVYDGNIVEIFFWNLFPTFAFGILFGLNMNILYTLALSGTLVAILTHSGYRLFDGGMMDTGHHDLHHERMKCNYSSPFVDQVMGTYLYREPDKIYPKFDKTDKIFTDSHNTTCV